MMFLLVILSMMYTFLSSKSDKHTLSQNMPIERSALFFKSGKCVLFVLREGACFEELKLYVMDR